VTRAGFGLTRHPAGPLSVGESSWIQVRTMIKMRNNGPARMPAGEEGALMHIRMGGRFWPTSEQLLTALVCLEPRLMAAYQATLSEVVAGGRAHERIAVIEADVSVPDARSAAAGAAA
jgi:hypothetical protein